MTDGLVLVHGGFHGAWCFDKLAPLLHCPVVAVDLPGRGARPAGDRVVTLDDCMAAVLEDAEAAGFDRFVLAGHSMGGLTITATAGAIPERIDHLVYVAALALPPGRNVLEHYGIPHGAKSSPGEVMGLLDEETCHTLFAADLSDAEYAEVHRRLVPEPMGLFEASVEDYCDEVPCTYVGCSRDQAVSEEATEEMLAVLDPLNVERLDSDHDVMLSHPAELAAVLNPLVRR